MNTLKKIVISVLLAMMILPISSVMAAFTLQQAVNSIQATDPALPTGVANPKGSIGSLLAELFWGTGDGTKNGKIKPQYIDYSGISAWSQSGSDAFYSGTGNVGIGTAIPSAYLHLKGTNISSRGQLTLEGSDFTQMTFYKDATTRSMSFYQNQADGSLVLSNAINNGNISNILSGAGNFFVQGGNGLVATINGSAPANSFYVNSSGNVGIGTPTPNKLLHLKTVTGTNAELDIQSGVKPLWGIYHDETSEELRFWNGSNRVVFGSGGNVGIGTASPGARLEVSGTANAYTAIFQSSLTSSQAYGPMIRAGTNSSDTAFTVNDATNTNSLFRVRGDGNVGIGTTSPSAKLYINSAIGYDGIKISADNGSSLSLYQPQSHASAKNWSIVTNYEAWGNLDLRISADNATTPSLTKMSITSAGNVGIGTTSPGTKLHVVGAGEMVRIENTNTAANNIAQIAILASGTANYIWSNNSNSPGYYGGNSALNIYAGTSSPIAFFTNGNYERMRISGTNGNVGIGTPNPAGRLHVDANPQTTIPIYVTTSDDNNGATKNPLDWQYVPGIIIGNNWSGNAATVNSTKIAKIVLNTAAGGYNNGASIHVEGAGGYDQGQLIFSTGWNSSSLATERMRINASGNVGIGTASPGYKLTVNGQPAANGYTAFTNYSDRRLKENIADITDGSLEKILKLRPVEYNYNDTYFNITGYDTATKDKKFRGFIAQELREVFPEMVGEKPFGDKKYLDTDLSNLQIYTIKAIKELKFQKDSEVQELKKENNELKSLICLDHPSVEMCK
ncbi:MAG: tail fiber domain-containing protein [Candidatus Gracilibacteria bacterium]|nr:tail fiber domain-containing protein [Candidatus Gracilibacteria bacterium]